ncbi:MAG TPA: formate--phosphoribosylaminoimidazolecarboxamide ligase [Candidatus Syntrophoarchaeum butanivorans]|uniref:5-formaminoimidazole-4-carboxamide-1-(beta)-D-ribofuranosyl 5'-monophosphate synthetase n=1 Tax=Candidatus Syntropharchaeum butanivorans TaxID=1839936 RepID=A0A7J2RZP9_9EURY|nr:formate--phosphoribosylaminoimidazolecarboxamide ligase [Candidatus Syntrophoarchaeum butanivorans]
MIENILEGYDEPTITTVCSHSSLQIFDGARKEGFRTLGIALKKPPKFYDAFPRAKPDDFMIVESYQEISARTNELIERDAIVIPHGSFVEYMGAERFKELEVPTFGNRKVLEWESDRRRERRWLEGAGLRMPAELSLDEVDRPVIVKYHGAKGGSSFFIARDREEIEKQVDMEQEFTIQEFILGTRYYIHYFYSPIREDGYRLSKGTLEVLGIDRRVESNIDEIYRLGSVSELSKEGIKPSFVVTGNLPLVLRESLLPKVFEMGEQVVEESLRLFGGVIGPFCLETICTDDLEFVVFEISARIVAGTNLYISGSPYADLIEEGLSTGRRIAKEIREALELGRLPEVVT